jgi:outer membrane lipoprotein-sorting protein
MKLLWLVLVLAFFCVGWGGSWEEIRTAAGTFTSVQAKFTQEKHLPILIKPLVSEGAFYFQAPRSLRWEYLRPVQSIMTVHDGRVRKYVSTGSNCFHEETGGGIEAMQVVVEEITHWLAGRFDDNPMFESQLEPGKRIVLVPKNEAFQKVIQRIVLNLGEQPGMMQSVEIYESENAFTKITFNNTVLNAKIDETLFQKIP